MKAWGITDGSAGMEAQVRALAQAMHIPVEMKKVKLKPYTAFLPNSFYICGLARLVLQYGIAKASDTLENPLPKLVISCGRRAAVVAIGLRRTPANTQFIHIQDPYVSSKHFDVVVAMGHDKIIGKNVIKTRYALHRITPELLAESYAAWQPHFAHLPKPHIAVLIGGSTNKYRLTSAAMHKLISDLYQVKGSLLITTSRRTGAENLRLLDFHLHGHKNISLYDGTGENPYFGMLACADTIIVTNDSVNMMSEALATQKPVFIAPLTGHKNTKPSGFAKRLVEGGIASWLGEEMPKNIYSGGEMKEVADKVLSLLLSKA